ncbi:MAG TPA: hypothetical protein VFX59_29640, partial [Polyangiales bacterium]|nr:hypothetical protein [Polyangiales bacterium]
MDVVIPRLARASSRTPERYRTAALLPLVRIAAAAACGTSLHAEHELVALMPLVFVIFWRAQSRLESSLVAAAYHAAAAVPLMSGAQAFYGFSEFEALLLVGTMATGVGCVWGAFWISPWRDCAPAQVVLRAVGLLVVTNVPPLCALAVPSPLLAAGVWFPGWSWCGVVAFVVAV